MKPPKVSICIPTYNGREHLRECLDSVRAQSCRDFEVVICDDQSSDGTLDFARELAQEDERFRFIQNPRRFGLVGNWNNAIEQAHGEWIKFVFQDDILAPACVEKLLQACALTGKSFGFCARDFIFEDGTSESLREWFLSHQAALDSSYGHQATIEAEAAGRMALQDHGINPVGEPTVTLIRKSLFEQVGFFDEALIQYCDTEFWFRIMSNQGAVWLPDRLATFRIHSKATTATNLRSRSYRMGMLDPLIVLYRFAFDRRFSRLRANRLAGRWAIPLRWECVKEAYRARREASQRVDLGVEEGRSLMTEWKAAASHCPQLDLLAGIGRAIARGHKATKSTGQFLKKLRF